MNRVNLLSAIVSRKEGINIDFLKAKVESISSNDELYFKTRPSKIMITSGAIDKFRHLKLNANEVKELPKEITLTGILPVEARDFYILVNILETNTTIIFGDRNEHKFANTGCYLFNLKDFDYFSNDGEFLIKSDKTAKALAIMLTD